ncbi:MAG: cation diffusion facilitator family transporter [Candidatus Hodarchaeales archaeon]|jgi:cation diffusion facilitator family transporter
MVENSGFDATIREVTYPMEQERKDLLAEGERATFITMICNILLIIFKIVTAIFIGSIALLASGLDALTDLIANLAVLLGLRYSQKNPSKRFSYGYYRMETLATLIVAIFILLFGLSVIIESISIIITPSILFQPVFGLLISFISILAAFSLYRYNLKIGNKIASNALIGTAKEFQLDTVTNSLVFLGILAHMIEFPQLEGLVGLAIGALIIKTGLEFGRNSLLILLDAIDDPDLIERMRSIVLHYSEIQEVSNIRIRRSGPYYFADIEIQMHTTETVKSLARVTHQLESSLKEKISQLDSIMISVEPVLKTCLKVAIAVSSLDTDTDETPAEHFGLAPAFLIADIDIPSQTIISIQIVENPHRLAERKRGILGAEFLVKKGIDILSIKDPATFGIGPKAIFSDNNVLLDPFRGQTIQEILEGFKIYQAKAQKAE